ncbi:MAG: 50S ribosomal protein L21 [Turicibacter sp.]|nr:50S ribosomal protein L21 [Turicibacter sp.]
MYAIIETGGKQHKVAVGDTVTVEKLHVQDGTDYNFDRVLSISNEGNVNFGTPYINGASVAAQVLETGRGKKIIVYKYKAKKNYHRKMGHRQPFTKLKITAINA